MELKNTNWIVDEELISGTKEAERIHLLIRAADISIESKCAVSFHEELKSFSHLAYFIRDKLIFLTSFDYRGLQSWLSNHGHDRKLHIISLKDLEQHLINLINLEK